MHCLMYYSTIFSSNQCSRFERKVGGGGGGGGGGGII